MMTLAFLLTDVHSNNNLTKFGVILMDVFRVRAGPSYQVFHILE